MAVVGYYSLSQSSIRLDTIPEASAKATAADIYDMPVTLLGRLAIECFGAALRVSA